MIDSRWTIRTKLSAVYGVTVLLAGTVLLGVTYLLFGQVLSGRPVNMSIVVAHQSPQPPSTNDAAISSSRSVAPAEDDASLRLAEELQADFRRSALSDLVTQGSVGLIGLVLVGAWLGWLMAGRTVGPIKQITATARRINDGSLHERADLNGPKDELHELADSFNDMLSRLDSAFDRQRRFIANASHELKTPLTISRALIEVGLEKSDIRESLLDVNARQERIINGLLQLARSDQGLVAREPLDLAQLAEQVVQQAGLRDEIRVSTSFAHSPMQGDAVLLEQLIHNLVQNAIQYNTPDGSVWVRCAPAADGVRLQVENTGPVVRPAEAAVVFEPFLRLGDRAGPREGSGLGLSIVRFIARAHDGDGTAAPRKEGGLVVTICFPAARGRDDS